jgi:hypothetical protein
MTVLAVSKLPLWRTIGQAYAMWASRSGDLVRCCWLWMLVMAPIMGIWHWLETPRLIEMLESVRARERFSDPNPMLSLAMQIAASLVMLPALTSVAVAWHRLLLREEHPDAAYLRFDGVVVGYAVLAFLIGLITLGPGYVSALLQIATGTSATMQDSGAVAVQSVAGLVTLVGFFIVTRLSLALPARALGRHDVTLGTAWAVTKHNTWRMAWAYAFCLLPWMAVGAVESYWLLHSDFDRMSLTLVLLARNLLGIPFGMISVGMLSVAYRHFFESART